MPGSTMNAGSLFQLAPRQTMASTNHDGKVKNSEVTYLTTICGKLGFPPETAKNALRWSRDLVKLNQERNLMIAALKQLRPVYA